MADSEWLKSTVGDALAAALTTLAQKQPEDPVDFLGHYLVQYADYLGSEAKKGEKLKALEIKTAEVAAEKVTKEDIEEMLLTRENMRKKSEEELVWSLSQTTDHKAIFNKVLAAVKSATGGSDAYIGKKIELSEAAPYIRYVASAEGSEFMVGQVLKGVVPGSEEEGGEEGVTWRVWKELPASEEEIPEEPVEGEDAAPKPPALPEYVHVENVIRDTAVRHFGVPKLGAYLAVPVTFASGIHDDGIGVAAPPSAEGGEAAEGEEPAPAAPPAPTGPVKMTKNVQLVLGLDSMGQARHFTPTQVEAALWWGKTLAKALEKADATLWDEELQRATAIEADTKAALAKVVEVKTQLAAAAAALEGQEDGPAKKLAERAGAFAIAKAALLGERAYLDKLAALLIKPKGLHYFKLAQAVLALLDLSPKEPGLWESLRLALGDGEAFWGRVEACCPAMEGGSEPLSKPDIEKHRAAIDGITEAEVEGVSPESFLLLRWISSVLDVSEAIHDKREADAAAAIAAAEAAAAAAEAEAE